MQGSLSEALRSYTEYLRPCLLDSLHDKETGRRISPMSYDGFIGSRAIFLPVNDLLASVLDRGCADRSVVFKRCLVVIVERDG